ncbi:Predicted DNA binding protein, contains HTH domain [Haladaptatus litoreus]|uniref:Predicted DNA binding protein, contains HTH domain n=1 Tax=Haladaptatus litoreus TaxID=553468 RepID=A0A1N6V060_9EURY|nr:helix-turn-helix domain-containing protein [Haladaptatus litoreus]SIQ71202.1 Predicted DNA binding protein, contains HTH domain [Haladaptatus litoreus]
MKYLRLSLDPGQTTVHPVYDVLTGADCIERARGLHGNVSGNIATLLFHIRGDVERFTTILDDIEQVLDYDVTSLSDDEFYCYIHNETTAVDGALFAAFTRESVVQISPVEYHDDGRATFAVVGPSVELQDAMADAPSGIDLRVERIGDGAPERAVTAGLSERQREAAEIAVELGYYDVPRRASHEDVADALECAPSTAAEHLRKAEYKVFSSSFP